MCADSIFFSPEEKNQFQNSGYVSLYNDSKLYLNIPFLLNNPKKIVDLIINDVLFKKDETNHYSLKYRQNNIIFIDKIISVDQKDDGREKHLFSVYPPDSIEYLISDKSNKLDNFFVQVDNFHLLQMLFHIEHIGQTIGIDRDAKPEFSINNVIAKIWASLKRVISTRIQYRYIFAKDNNWRGIFKDSFGKIIDLDGSEVIINENNVPIYCYDFVENTYGYIYGYGINWKNHEIDAKNVRFENFSPLYRGRKTNDELLTDFINALTDGSSSEFTSKQKWTSKS